MEDTTNKNIPDDISFDSDCRLNRKVQGESLTELVNLFSDGCVISLNGSWGSGKTHFIKSWKNMLEEDNYNVLYFDAFKCDYLDDPFTAIAGEINRYVSDIDTEEKKSILAKFRDNAERLAKKYLPFATSMVSKALLLDLLKDTDFEAIKDDVANTLSTDVSNIFEDRIGAYTDGINEIESFRSSFKEIAKLVRSQTGHPLIFIIDELDRCRPNFSVSLLEKIKHLFSASGVTFILVMDRVQLAASIKKVYGLEFNAVKYLDKFITVEYRLAINTETVINGDYRQFVEHTASEMNFKISNVQSNSLAVIAQHFKVSLRDIQRALLYLQLIITKQSGWIEHGIIPFLILLRYHDVNCYDRMKNKEISHVDFKKGLNINLISLIDNKWYSKYWSELKALIATDNEWANLRNKESNKGWIESINFKRDRNYINQCCMLIDEYSVIQPLT